MDKPYPTGMVRPQDFSVPPQALALFSRQLAAQYRVCPLGFADDSTTLCLAAYDTTNQELINNLEKTLNRCVKLFPASEQDIMLGIAMHYHQKAGAAQNNLLTEFGTIPAASTVSTSANSSERLEARPTERFTASTTVDSIIQRAVSDRASDIHIEPQENLVYVRFRVDGILYDHLSYDHSQHAQIISRIKILANLDIAQNRLAQDGRFDFSIKNQQYDVRVSVVPLLSGQKAVLRLLPKGTMNLGLHQLGMNTATQRELQRLISLPFGMFVATGPTGSGKTTTLYACLSSLDSVQKNIVTVEDPVEYRFPRVGQIQVHTKIGLTFASGLRMLLRQDPDVIMVGEIRDFDTLEMAIHASLTGHLVFSTLHCNDAAAAAARLVDMGAEPFLVASSISGFLAQRLIRKLCPQCKRPAVVPPLMRAQLRLPDDDTIYYQAVGCAHCRNTGYYGRISVFEIVPMQEVIQEAIMRKASAGEIRRIIREAGITSMWDDALEKARASITSLEDITRAVLINILQPEVME